jgi:hypothetical protein
MPEPEAASSGTLDELTESLDRKLRCLPEKYRIPIVLCELEGKSHKQAAEQLGWPIGTVSGRLSRAKAMLAKRLSRRGVSLSAGSLAMRVGQGAASASMPTNLVAHTAQAASLVVAGQASTAGAVSSKVSASTQRVLKFISLGKVQRVALFLLALAGAGAGIWQTRSRAEGTALPESVFRSSVHEVIKDGSVIVTQIDVETLPGASVEVVADKPDRGGLFLLASRQAGGSAHTEVTIFADHVEWKPGRTNVLKFIMSIRGGAGFSSMSDTGPMPEDKRLEDVLTVAIKSGEYKNGTATKLAIYKDVTYSLVVKKAR